MTSLERLGLVVELDQLLVAVFELAWFAAGARQIRHAGSGTEATNASSPRFARPSASTDHGSWPLMSGRAVGVNVSDQFEVEDQ